MKESNVKLCLDELKNKKCEGFDRIPVCIIRDACNFINILNLKHQQNITLIQNI